MADEWLDDLARSSAALSGRDVLKKKPARAWRSAHPVAGLHVGVAYRPFASQPDG